MKLGTEGVMVEWRKMQERIDALQKENDELREALYELVDSVDRFDVETFSEKLEMARNALAKASGEEVKQ